MSSPLPNPPTPEERAAASRADSVMIGDLSEADLLVILRGYLEEAKNARRSGDEPRDPTWEANRASYWNQYDQTAKANWQSKTRIPTVANHVERFSAALREALTDAGRWYSFTDPLDSKQQLKDPVEDMVEMGLAESGQNTSGQPVGFDHTFGISVKAGTTMAIALAVTWEGGRLRIGPVDPRELYYDPTGRGLYRIREYPVDKYQLREMADETDAAGEPLYIKENIERLLTAVDEQQSRKDAAAGHPKGEQGKERDPILVQEFLCTILDSKGNLVEKNQLVVMANEMEIIRKPEINPFDHKRDWIVYAPIIHVPFSVYGRTYVELFGQIVDAFIEMVNLARDGIFAEALNAFMMWPDLVDDPNEVKDGIAPNKVIMASDDAPPGTDFIKSIRMGQGVKPEGIALLNLLKQEIREAASQNEISLGGIPGQEVKATEVVEAKAGTQALVASIARDIEEQVLNPVLELTYLTQLQHMDFRDEEVIARLGEEVALMFAERSDEFVTRKFKMQAKGLSGMIKKGKMLRSMLQLLSIVSSNPVLARAFLQKYSVASVIDVLVRSLGIDPDEITASQAEIVAQTAPATPGSEDDPGSVPVAAAGAPTLGGEEA